jgi:MFS family permease
MKSFPSDFATEDSQEHSSLLLLVVFFSTVATLMITTVLPAYFRELHLTYRQIGTIEGWAACAAFMSKFFSGILADRISDRRLLVMAGTGLNVISKACFALATSGASILTVQVADRLAKGMRSLPLDAMISDNAGRKKRSYGLKHVAFFSGSIVGGYVTFQLLNVATFKLRSIFGAATIPAIIAFLLASNIKRRQTSLKPIPLESVSTPAPSSLKLLRPIRFINMCPTLNFDKFLWRLYAVLFVHMFGRFSISFLGLKAMSVGMQITDLPRIYMLYDGSAALAAFFWVLSKQNILFKAALITHIAAHSVLFMAQGKWSIFAGVVLAGVHAGMSQGAIMYMISSHTEHGNRATAFAVYALVASVGLLLSNKFAGWLSSIDLPFAFLGGAVFCTLTLFAFMQLQEWTGRSTLNS